MNSATAELRAALTQLDNKVRADMRTRAGDAHGLLANDVNIGTLVCGDLGDTVLAHVFFSTLLSHIDAVDELARAGAVRAAHVQARACLELLAQHILFTRNFDIELLDLVLLSSLAGQGSVPRDVNYDGLRDSLNLPPHSTLDDPARNSWARLQAAHFAPWYETAGLARSVHDLINKTDLSDWWPIYQAWSDIAHNVDTDVGELRWLRGDSGNLLPDLIARTHALYVRGVLHLQLPQQARKRFASEYRRHLHPKAVSLRAAEATLLLQQVEEAASSPDDARCELKSNQTVIFNRSVSRADAARQLGPLRSVLSTVRPLAMITAEMCRAETTERAVSRAVLSVYRNVLVQIDAIDLLLSAGQVPGARLQARSAYEAAIYCRYLARLNNEVVAGAYLAQGLVAIAERRNLPGVDVYALLHCMLSSESGLADGLKALKAARRSHPHASWYSVNNGPRTTRQLLGLIGVPEELARGLGEILFQSAFVSHSGDLLRGIGGDLNPRGGADGLWTSSILDGSHALVLATEAVLAYFKPPAAREALVQIIRATTEPMTAAGIRVDFGAHKQGHTVPEVLQP